MKTVELYNVNSDYYWNIDEFLKGYGYKNVQEFCAYEKDTLGAKDYCENIVQTAMFEQAVYPMMYRRFFIYSSNSQLKNVNENASGTSTVIENISQ